MKRKSNGQQLSMFDIVLEPPKQSDIPPVPSAPVKREETPVRALGNCCPYKVPTVEEIVREVQNASGYTSSDKLFSDIVECGALSISNAVDKTQFGKREERYMQIVNGYHRPAELKAMTEIFAKMYMLLTSVTYDDGCFSDYLGEIFMRLNMANNRLGQVFTPYHIAEFIARITIGENVREQAANDEILTINDPCCGSGAMSIGALDVLKSYGINYARNCFIECSDIDIRCVHMAYLQLSLAGVPAIIKHQNSLTREVWSVWKTPAYLMQYLRFRKYENLN